MKIQEKIRKRKEAKIKAIGEAYRKKPTTDTIDRLALKYGYSVATIYNIIRKYKKPCD